MSSFRANLTELIATESGLDPNKLNDTVGLMSTGILDSFALVTVISFVEQYIGTEVPSADLTYEHFDSVAAISSYVEQVLAQD